MSNINLIKSVLNSYSSPADLERYEDLFNFFRPLLIRDRIERLKSPNLSNIYFEIDDDGLKYTGLIDPRNVVEREFYVGLLPNRDPSGTRTRSDQILPIQSGIISHRGIRIYQDDDEVWKLEIATEPNISLYRGVSEKNGKIICEGELETGRSIPLSHSGNTIFAYNEKKPKSGKEINISDLSFRLFIYPPYNRKVT